MQGNFLDGLFDAGTRIFNKIIDTDLRKLELNLISQANASQKAAEKAAAPVITSSSFNASSLIPLVIVGAAGVGLILLLRK